MGCTQSKSTDAAEDAGAAAPMDHPEGRNRAARIWKRMTVRRKPGWTTPPAGDNNQPLEPGTKPEDEVHEYHEYHETTEETHILIEDHTVLENGTKIGELHKSEDPDDLDLPPSSPPPPPPTDDTPAPPAPPATPATPATPVTVVTETQPETTEVEKGKGEEAVEKPEIEDLDITEVMQEMKLPPRVLANSTNTEEPANDASGELISETNQEHLETAVQLLDQAENFLQVVKIEPIAESFGNEMDEQMSRTDRKTAACMPLTAEETEAKLAATSHDATVESSPPEEASEEVSEPQATTEETAQATSAPPAPPAPEEVAAPAADNAPPVEEVTATESSAPAATESVPEVTTSAESVPEVTTPAESVPEAVTPAESAPEAATPAESAPEAATPAESAPEAAIPAESAPQEAEAPVTSGDAEQPAS